MTNSQKAHAGQNALINYVFISTDANAKFNREKLAARNDLRHFSSNKSQRNCGVAPLMPLRVSKVRGKYRHDATVACKNRNSCPWCSTRSMAEQRTKIYAKCIHALDVDGMCLSAVLTLPNRNGHDLKYAYKVLIEQTSRFRRIARRFEPEFGVVGSVRVFEETFGERRGWHPHANYIWFTTRLLTTDEQSKFEAQIKSAWLMAANQGGIRGTSESAQWMGCQSTDKEVKTTARYVTKHSYYVKARPLRDLQGKFERLEPWQVLELARSGDMKWIQVWKGYEIGVKGRRRVAYLS